MQHKRPPSEVVRTVTLENGITLHSWVIGLPFFHVRDNAQEEATPETKTSVN
jgi:hypothetical protein